MHHPPRDTGWFKSSYSGGGTDTCVECRLTETVIPDRAVDTGWFKSTHSSVGDDACVEARLIRTTATHIRDSKNPTGPTLTVHTPAWTTFLTTLTQP